MLQILLSLLLIPMILLFFLMLIIFLFAVLVPGLLVILFTVLVPIIIIFGGIVAIIECLYIATGMRWIVYKLKQRRIKWRIYSRLNKK